VKYAHFFFTLPAGLGRGFFQAFFKSCDSLFERRRENAILRDRFESFPVELFFAKLSPQIAGNELRHRLLSGSNLG
jgi:hypothetical protein